MKQLVIIVVLLACIVCNIRPESTTTTLMSKTITAPYYEAINIPYFTGPETENTEPLPVINIEDANLIALVTMAEAEGQDNYSKRLVIDTILNRVTSTNFPNTIHDVVYQKNQFTSMWNGRIKRCTVKPEIYQLVVEEMTKQANYDVIFFTAGRYSKYGIPMFKSGDHFFSKYK